MERREGTEDKRWRNKELKEVKHVAPKGFHRWEIKE